MITEIFALMMTNILKYFLVIVAVVAVIAALIGFCVGTAYSSEPEKRIILFHAAWCKYCPSQMRIVKSIEAKGYKTRYVDIDKEKAFAQSLKIKGVPTTIIVRIEGDQAVETNRFSGQTSPETILKALK